MAVSVAHDDIHQLNTAFSTPLHHNNHTRVLQLLLFSYQKMAGTQSSGDLAPHVQKVLESTEPQISRTLYGKAAERNEELTKVERILLLSRRDVYGKVFYKPESITEYQRNSILGRPPPEVLKQNIKGMLGVETIAEVLEKYWNPDRTDQLRTNALSMITTNWWTWGSDDIYGSDHEDEDEDSPAAVFASMLVQNIEEDDFEDAVTERLCEAANEGAMESDEEELATTIANMDMSTRYQEQKKARDERETEKARLDKELKDLLEAEVHSLSTEEVAELKALMDQMEIEEPKDEEETARQKAELIEKLKEQGLYAGDDDDSDYGSDDDSDEDMEVN